MTWRLPESARYARGLRVNPASAFFELLRDEVEQLIGRLGDIDAACLDPAGEIVEDHDGRDGDEKTEGRGDERFGDTRRHRSETAGPGGGHHLEGVHDTHDGSEQTDEGGGRGDRGEHALSALEQLHLARRMALERAGHR